MIICFPTVIILRDRKAFSFAKPFVNVTKIDIRYRHLSYFTLFTLTNGQEIFSLFKLNTFKLKAGRL